MNKLSKVVVCLLISAVFVMPISAMNEGIVGIKINNSCEITVSLNGGWLEEQNGVKILHLNGSYYDMGYQHGFLLKDEIQECMRTQLVFFEDFFMICARAIISKSFLWSQS